MVLNQAANSAEGDLCSVLVPCLGFDNSFEGQAALQLYDQVKRSGEALAPIKIGRKTYLPIRPIEPYTGSSTSHLMARDLGTFVPTWTVLRKADSYKPSGSFNAAVVVEGRRQFCEWSNHYQPNWWDSVTGGIRDCYVVWGRKDSVSLFRQSECRFPSRLPTLAAIRSGRAVIYARQPVLNASGEPYDHQATCVLVEMDLLDSNPKRDDLMRVRTRKIAVTSKDPDFIPDLPDALDPIWTELCGLAKRGFAETCASVPESVEKWLAWFRDQRAKHQLDKEKGESSFRHSIWNLPWQQALDSVSEAWQLAVVIYRHADARFDDRLERSPSRFLRVMNMLAQYPCSEERKSQLKVLISEYIELIDSTWHSRSYN